MIRIGKCGGNGGGEIPGAVLHQTAVEAGTGKKDIDRAIDDGLFQIFTREMNFFDLKVSQPRLDGGEGCVNNGGVDGRERVLDETDAYRRFVRNLLSGA